MAARAAVSAPVCFLGEISMGNKPRARQLHAVEAQQQDVAEQLPSRCLRGSGLGASKSAAGRGLGGENTSDSMSCTSTMRWAPVPGLADQAQRGTTLVPSRDKDSRAALSTPGATSHGWQGSA